MTTFHFYSHVNISTAGESGDAEAAPSPVRGPKEAGRGQREQREQATAYQVWDQFFISLFLGRIILGIINY